MFKLTSCSHAHTFDLFAFEVTRWHFVLNIKKEKGGSGGQKEEEYIFSYHFSWSGGRLTLHQVSEAIFYFINVYLPYINISTFACGIKKE